MLGENLLQNIFPRAIELWLTTMHSPSRRLQLYSVISTNHCACISRTRHPLSQWLRETKSMSIVNRRVGDWCYCHHACRLFAMAQRYELYQYIEHTVLPLKYASFVVRDALSTIVCRLSTTLLHIKVSSWCLVDCGALSILLPRFTMTITLFHCPGLCTANLNW